ncbi:MAG TPA: enoyl-CoA hydratase/isomerase family protein [Burkholderiales bacterium]|jgi:enoyl-CoA hydratase/carnithine racemase|nr:enoyl-CoA hydratase/isomerase family protein [Burkholderiales bacterium]
MSQPVTVELERHPGWALLRIARAEKRNAVDRATRAALAAALDSLRDMRAIVITGSGASFCAGIDLKEREAEIAAGRTDTAGEEWLDFNMALREHPAVCIAAVNGLALGAGLTLVNSCDLAVAAESAIFGTPEISFGSYASMAGPTLQRSGLTRKRVAWMLLTAPRLDAAAAERWGLINEVTADAALLSRAAVLAAEIAARDAVALAEIKQTLDRLPAQAGWREAMQYGQTVNAAIRARRAAPST